MGQWLLYGAPAGILHQPLDPGIFPDAAAPPQINPIELTCDVTTFRNYAGVEEHSTTEEEMQAHIDKHHLREFDTFEELSQYVGGKPTLSKIGLIAKIRNGVTKHRFILDAKESWVKSITSKTQRVIFRDYSMRYYVCCSYYLC